PGRRGPCAGPAGAGTAPGAGAGGDAEAGGPGSRQTAGAALGAGGVACPPRRRVGRDQPGPTFSPQPSAGWPTKLAADRRHNDASAQTPGMKKPAEAGSFSESGPIT